MTIHRPAFGSGFPTSRPGINMPESLHNEDVPHTERGDLDIPMSRNEFNRRTLWLDNHSGLHRLTHELTIQGTTVQPKFIFFGGDATATSWPSHAGAAPALSIAGTGNAPTLQAPSPFLHDELHDNTVKFNGGKYYSSSDTQFDLTTGDAVWEIVFEMDFTKANIGFGSKRGGSPTNGWDFIAVQSLSALRFNLFVGGSSVNIQIGGFSANTIEHVMVFLNRDVATTNGCRMFRNGVNIGGTNASALTADASSTSDFYLGTHSFSVGTLQGNRTQSWCGMWESAGWFNGTTDVTDWDAFAKQRARKVFGGWPRLAKGSASATIYSRASRACVDHNLYLPHGRRYFFIGNHAIRSVKFNDTNGKARGGFHIEEQTTNLCPDSTSTVNAASGNTTITADSVTFLNGIDEADLVTESTDGAPATHTCEHSKATASVSGSDTIQYCVSVHLQAVDRTEFQLIPDTTANIDFQLEIDLSDGTIVKTTGDKAGIVEYGDMGSGTKWYRVWVTATQSGAGSWNPQIVLKSGGSTSYTGDGSDAVNICGWQVVAVGTLTSWVRTSGATATKIIDNLRYKGDDGNLGGVGSDLRGTVRCNVFWYGGDHPATGSSGDGCALSISDGASVNDNLQVFHDRQSGVGGGAGGYSNNFSSDLSDGTHHDIAHTWSNTNLSVETHEGDQDLIDSTTATIPNDLDQIEIGATLGGTTAGNVIVGNIIIENVDRTKD